MIKTRPATDLLVMVMMLVIRFMILMMMVVMRTMTVVGDKRSYDQKTVEMMATHGFDAGDAHHGDRPDEGDGEGARILGIPDQTLSRFVILNPKP